MAYKITCDGSLLLHPNDDDFIVINPRVSLEENKVGEGSFTIYKNHPHYDKLKKLKSVFEVSDENGAIFRGRATSDSIKFDLGMAVDLEGVMAFFNDSVVRPFNFPSDWMTSGEYWEAYNNGNVVEFFMKWLIDSHNAQVTEAQRFKLGRVTVADPNNNVTRSNENYSTTLETIKSKLFESALGGYLCIRYEPDGNYIDYLASYEETNTQEIVYGENMLDLIRESAAVETYSAILPLGADKLTIKDIVDGDITDDIVKSGNFLYSKSAVEAYGWICAPTSETTWDDVTLPENLCEKGAKWLYGKTTFATTIDATAADLHFTDTQIRSFRMYKGVKVRSEPHGFTDVLPLTRLDLDLHNPQNSKIKAGKTYKALTDLNKSDMTIENRVSKTEKQIADLMYSPIAIMNFAIVPNSVEAGDTLSSVSFTWGFNKIPVSVSLHDWETHLSEEMDIFSTGTVINGLTITGARSWRLQATDERGETAQDEVEITVTHGVYYGVGDAQTAFDSDFVNSLDVEWRTNKKPSVHLSPKSQHIYYCLPTWMGTCKFTVGVFEGGFELADTISFTNEHGYTQNYYIYKSVEALSATVTVYIS